MTSCCFPNFLTNLNWIWWCLHPGPAHIKVKLHAGFNAMWQPLPEALSTSAYSESLCTYCLAGGTRHYWHCRRWEKNKNISPGLPRSLALCSCPLAVSAGFSSSKQERITFRKKNWKSVEIHNETGDQRNSIADHQQSLGGFFCSVCCSSDQPLGLTTGLHWSQEHALAPAAPRRHHGQRGPGSDYVKNCGSACCNSDWSLLDFSIWWSLTALQSV